jgi:hypothetical protein
MELEQSRYIMRVYANLLKKFRYIAKYEERSVNSEIIQMMLGTVKQFEEKVGPIPDDLD